MKNDYPDLRKIDQIYEQDYIRAGYKTMALDPLGNQVEVIDEEPFKKALFELVTSREADQYSKSDNGWTVGQVYSNLFPGAPGADGTPVESLDLNQRGAYEKHLRRIGQLCGPGTTGAIQSRLAEEPPDADGNRRVLCQGKITRGYDLVDGFWITRDPDLVLAAWEKKVEKWAKEAESLRNFGRMLVSRQPGLGGELGKALRAGETRVKVTLAELANSPASTRAIAEKSTAE